MRGPAVLSPVPGRPVLPTRRDVFDRIVLDVAGDLESRWSQRLGLVEYGVEDTPQVPDDWDVEHRVPLSSLVRGQGTRPTRLVMFRRPVEHRAADRAELEVLVRTVMVEQVAELLGLPPEDVDPDWAPLED